MKRRNLHSEEQSTTTVSKDILNDTFETGNWLEKYPRRLFAALLVFRSINAILSYTAFVPDETWQSLEVAHSIVFGYPFSLHVLVLESRILIQIHIYVVYHNDIRIGALEHLHPV